MRYGICAEKLTGGPAYSSARRSKKCWTELTTKAKFLQ